MKKLFSPDQRTSFKPYLIEFFMILLAITAGFFVENFREAQAEKAEAKQYMNSLLHDLKLDRQILEFNRGLGDIVLSSTDSLVAELGRRPLKGREQKLYHYFMLSNNFYAEYFNKTMTQLEASGKFRIIQNQQVADAWVDYDGYMELVMALQSSPYRLDIMHDYLTISQKVFFMPAVDKPFKK